MSALTDEEFERCVGDLITIASFQGEATDPAVVTVIQEARNGRAALALLRGLAAGGCWCGVGIGDPRLRTHGDVCLAVADLLQKAGRR